MISSTCWIPRGQSLQHPKKYNLDVEELQRVSTLANLHFDDAKQQLEQAQKLANDMKNGQDGDDWEDDQEDEDEDQQDGDGDGDEEMDDAKNQKKKDPNDLSEYNLDDYDNEQSTGTQMGAFSNIKGLQFYTNNEEDPYITLKEVSRQSMRRERDKMG